VLTELKNRGVDDACMVVCDGLTGLPDAINTVWPQTVVQTSSMHNRLAEMISVVTRTVPGRTCADAHLRGPDADLSARGGGGLRICQREQRHRAPR
jgi:Transposase, Mutator family